MLTDSEYFLLKNSELSASFHNLLLGGFKFLIFEVSILKTGFLKKQTKKSTKAINSSLFLCVIILSFRLEFP